MPRLVLSMRTGVHFVAYPERAVMRFHKLAHAAIVPDIARGLRAAIAMLIPFLLARELGRHELTWMALGGWLGTLVDPGGARGSRARTLVVFALAGPVMVVVGELLAPSPWASLGLLATTAFVASIVRVLGASAAALGTILAVSTAIAIGGSLGQPVRDAVAFAVGAGWAMILSSIVWPVWTHLPVRRAVAAAWRELAGYASEIEKSAANGVAEHDPRWSALARFHQPKIRAALEEAREVALASRARHNGESVLGSNLRTVLSLAETSIAQLIAFAEETESTPIDVRRATSFTHFAVKARAVADTLERPALAADVDPEVPAAEEAASAQRLVEASSVALRIVRAPSQPQDGPALSVGVARDDLRLLRDAFSIRSPIFAHALRVALATTAASIIGHRISPEHAHWVTITTLTVLQPFPGATLTRAAERVLGTVLGGLVAIVITMTIRAPLALAAIMFPLSVAAVATKPRSYRLFTFFLTPVFVLLAERSPSDWWVAIDRARDALVGGGVALAAAFLFPSHENERLADASIEVRQTLVVYATAVIERFLLSGADAERVILARRDVGIALGVADTSLERLLAEPRLVVGKSTAHAADRMLFLTQSRRLAGALTTLDASRLPSEGAGPAARATLAWVTAAVGGTPARRRPDLSGLSPELERALRRIERTATLLRA